jgi:hypothetical protein
VNDGERGGGDRNELEAAAARWGLQADDRAAVGGGGGGGGGISDPSAGEPAAHDDGPCAGEAAGALAPEPLVC